MTAVRTGLSAEGYGRARHRASGTPVHRPAVGSRRAHVRRPPPIWAGLVLLVVLVAGVVVWRVADASPEPDTSTPTTTTGSAVSTSTVTIGAAGDVHVVVDLQLPSAVDQVTLRVPDEAWAGDQFEPVVDGIGLDTGGGHVDVPGPLDAGQERTVALPAEVLTIRLEYDASGTFVASTPSAPGRGLVLLTPLTVAERDPLSQVEVLDARVRNLGCVGTGELMACATRDGDTWIASPVADAEQVIAQVDLDPR